MEPVGSIRTEHWMYSRSRAFYFGSNLRLATNAETLMLTSEKLQHSDAVIAQPNGADLLLFHLDSGNYYSLNELGARIWELCDGVRSFEEIVGLLESEYDATRERIEEDSQCLALSLVDNDLLAVRRAGDAVSG